MAPYTCRKCLAETWNDCDECDDCIEESRRDYETRETETPAQEASHD